MKKKEDMPTLPYSEPDWGQRGEELVSMATTFMDYKYKSPQRQEITTAKMQIAKQAQKRQYRLLPCINTFQITSDLQQILDVRPTGATTFLLLLLLADKPRPLQKLCLP